MAKKTAVPDVDKAQFKNPEGVTLELITQARAWIDMLRLIKEKSEDLAGLQAKHGEMNAELENALSALEGQRMKVDNTILRFEQGVRTLRASPKYATLLDLKGTAGYINQKLPQFVEEATEFLKKATIESGGRWEPEFEPTTTIKMEAEVWGKMVAWVKSFADKVYNWIRSSDEWINKVDSMLDAIIPATVECVPMPPVSIGEQELAINVAKGLLIERLNEKSREWHMKVATGQVKALEGQKHLTEIADAKAKIEGR